MPIQGFRLNTAAAACSSDVFDCQTKRPGFSIEKNRALLLSQRRTYLEVLVLVVLLVVSPFLFFLCFVLVFMVPPDIVSWLVDDEVEVFWANIAVPLRRERLSEAIMIFFIEIVSCLNL